MGTLRSWAILVVARVLVLISGPITAETLSCVINRVIAAAASDGSDLLSANINCSCLPFIPPVAFIWLAANLMPLVEDTPKVETKPVISALTPILMTLSAGCSALLWPPQPTSTNESAAKHATIVILFVCFFNKYALLIVYIEET
jgi:hypothetical protein